MWDKVRLYKQELDRCFTELQPGRLETIINHLKKARNIYIIGNGGSASTAAHMAVDFVRAGLPAISLVEPGQLSAIGNDFGYDNVFRTQLQVLLGREDVLLAISASGNSPNIIEAVRHANITESITMGFIGFGGGELGDHVDLSVTVSSKNYGVVEDFHLSLGHIISQHIRGIK
jgi:D-sedoheptulose 7-phosphate isomerase